MKPLLDRPEIRRLLGKRGPRPQAGKPTPTESYGSHRRTGDSHPSPDLKPFEQDINRFMQDAATQRRRQADSP